MFLGIDLFHMLKVCVRGVGDWEPEGSVVEEGPLLRNPQPNSRILRPPIRGLVLFVAL